MVVVDELVLVVFSVAEVVSLVVEEQGEVVEEER